MSHTLRIPAIYSPFSPDVHPLHEAVNAHTAAWARAHGIGSDELRRSLVQHEIGTFAARILPGGREEVVQIVADFVMWLFAVDDGTCEEGELGRQPGRLTGVLSRLLRVAQRPDVPMLRDDPLAVALADLRRRIDRCASAAQAERWVHALREYFFSVVWEAHHRSEGTLPGLSDYVLMRLATGATAAVMPLLEVAHGYELEASERDDPRVLAVGEMAYFLLCWDNDLFSFSKEQRSGRYVVNALPVLRAEYGLGLDDALALAVAQRDRVTCLYQRVQRELAASASPELGQYLGSISAFVRANQDWATTSARYTDDPADLPGVFSATPTDDSREPLPIPVIAPWWDLAPVADISRRSA